MQLFSKRFDRLGNIYSTKDLQQLSTAILADAKLLGSEYSADTCPYCPTLPSLSKAQVPRRLHGPISLPRSRKLSLRYTRRWCSGDQQDVLPPPTRVPELVSLEVLPAGDGPPVSRVDHLAQAR